MLEIYIWCAHFTAKSAKSLPSGVKVNVYVCIHTYIHIYIYIYIQHMNVP